MSAARDFDVNARRLTLGQVDKLGRMVALELLGRVIQETPVDTGRARGNWNVSVGREDPATNDERRAPQALQEGGAVIEGVKLGTRGDQVYVTNGLPYIGPLNNGHSQQAPRGYVQRIVRDMRSFVASAAAQLGSRLR